MDYSKIKNIYIIGIEGGGTSALASLYVSLGYQVSGSDEGDHFFGQKLNKQGIKIYEKFSPTNLPDTADLIVYSTAYNPDNNLELKTAQQGKIPVMSYPQALADLFNQRQGIAIAGSHGKTTTTAWLGYVLQQAGLEPSLIVGSQVPQLQGASLAGQSDYLIIEADEYQNKLQYYQPKMVLLNNIDYDHPDFFATANDYLQVFIDFIKKIPTNGWLVANLDDQNIADNIKTNCPAKIITYSLTNKQGDYLAKNIDYDQTKAIQSFTVVYHDQDLGQFTIKLAGKHNIANALAVIAASLELGLELSVLKQHLATFTGTVRRLQKIGEYNQAIILDDFGHHPTEIKATLSAVKQMYPNNKLKVVFHPHTFTRTKALFNDFVNSFDLADELIILDIYGSARESQGGVNSEELVEKIRLTHEQKKVRHIPSLTETEEYLRNNLQSQDVVLLLGAGDVFVIGQNLIK